ncbi:MAG: hypothetical protein EHM13_09075 [Acidobacteria bacterium]|nr:MAG: hypothetical protein EHM13_09075 [Acidobacteriota bacterium]
MIQSADEARVNVAMPSASDQSEWARNGAIVPAFTAASENCRKPCSDEESPRIDGKRSSRISVTLGMMIADVPAVLLGKGAAPKIPFKMVRLIAAVLFALLGMGVLLGLGSFA